MISPAITVQIENQSGVVQTADTSAVTLSIAQGAGSLAGTQTVNAVKGVATFNNILIDGTGTYALEATDGNDVPGTSASFTVTASPVEEDHLVFLQQPGTVIPGAVMTPAVEVEVEDPNGNLISTNAPISLAVSTGPGLLTGTSTVAAVNGIATFSNLVFPTVGGYTLSATSTAAAPTTSSQFNVGYHLVFAQSPMSVVAGNNIAATVIVEVEDQNGNLVTNQNPTVSLAVSSGPSAVERHDHWHRGQRRGHFQDADANKQYTLTATDDGAHRDVQIPSRPSRPPPSNLSFLLSHPKVANGKGTAVVAVEDAFGNVATGYKSQVKLTVISGPNKKLRSFVQNTIHGVADVQPHDPADPRHLHAAGN